MGGQKKGKSDALTDLALALACCDSQGDARREARARKAGGEWASAALDEKTGMWLSAAMAGNGARAWTVRIFAEEFGDGSEGFARACLQSALGCAAAHGDSELFWELAEAGADPLAQTPGPNRFGVPDAPLMIICAGGFSELAFEWLRRYPEADTEMKSKGPGQRLTAAQFARREGHGELASALEAWAEKKALDPWLGSSAGTCKPQAL